MAVVEMSKITLIGLNSDKEEILEKLMEQGVTEIVDKDRLSSEEWSRLMKKDGDAESVSQLDGLIEKATFALDKLSGFVVPNKSVFESKRSISKHEFNSICRNEDRIWEVINDIIRLDERQTDLITERNRIMNFINTLEPWKPLDVPLDLTETKNTVVFLGTVPAIIDAGKLERELYESVPECCIKCINNDRYQSYLFVICHNQVQEETSNILKKYGFTRVSFDDLSGTAAENIDTALQKVKRIDAECSEIQSRIASYAIEKPDIEVFYDFLVSQREKKKALDKILKTESTFMLEGWLPRDAGDTLKKSLDGKWECIVDITEPEDGEDFPVLLKNGKLGQSVESITEMYSLPDCHEIDPNTIMAPFFILFFGLMLGDGGYGLIMSIAAGIVLWKFNLEENMKKMARLVLYCGISTMFWGFMFGSWFGIPYFAERPIWLNPVEEPDEMLKWSLLFGVIHIYVGIAVRGANLIRKKKYLDAVLDTIPWYVFFTGFILYVLPYVPNMNSDNIDYIVSIGVKTLAIGAILLILTQGRDRKNIIGKLIGGISSLYDLIGFASDVLSYSRLLALGIATSIIASIVVEMGAMGGLDNVVKIIIFIIIQLIGNTINFAINALGAYVHSSRLQYIEFFGKFYKGGGKAFKPLKYKTKYINLKN